MLIQDQDSLYCHVCTHIQIICLDIKQQWTKKKSTTNLKTQEEINTNYNKSEWVKCTLNSLQWCARYSYMIVIMCFSVQGKGGRWFSLKYLPTSKVSVPTILLTPTGTTVRTITCMWTLPVKSSIPWRSLLGPQWIQGPQWSQADPRWYRPRTNTHTHLLPNTQPILPKYLYFTVHK